MSFYKRLFAPQKKAIQRCVDLIKRAEGILIAAGSGLSVDAGIDYTDTAAFARLFPAMVRRGFRMQYELIGYTDWSPELQWGYWAAHVNEVRFKTPPHRTYGRLLDIIRGREYFVITTNVDAMFFKNDFEKDRLFTPQGDYALTQCLKPCWRETWPIKPIIDRILPTIDPETQEVTDSSLIPHCPNCGGPVSMNVRGGHWFIEEPYQGQAARFTQWVNDNRERRLLILEIGSGFNTPGVIRWPMERIVHKNPKAHLIRVNLLHPQVPGEIESRSIPLKCGALDVITALWTALGYDTHERGGYGPYSRRAP